MEASSSQLRAADRVGEFARGGSVVSDPSCYSDDNNSTVFEREKTSARNCCVPNGSLGMEEGKSPVDICRVLLRLAAVLLALTPQSRTCMHIFFRALSS